MFPSMSALSVNYLNNFLKGSFVIKNLPYVNAAVSPEPQPEVEQRTCTGVCMCCKDITTLKQAVQAAIRSLRNRWRFEHTPKRERK